MKIHYFVYFKGTPVVYCNVEQCSIEIMPTVVITAAEPPAKIVPPLVALELL